MRCIVNNYWPAFISLRAATRSANSAQGETFPSKSPPPKASHRWQCKCQNWKYKDKCLLLSLWTGPHCISFTIFIPEKPPSGVLTFSGFSYDQNLTNRIRVLLLAEWLVHFTNSHQCCAVQKKKKTPRIPCLQMEVNKYSISFTTSHTVSLTGRMKQSNLVDIMNY